MKGLDKWLTTEPEDYFTPYFEQVMESITNEFYYDNETWCDSKECEDIVDEYYKKGWLPEDVAIIIPLIKKYMDFEQNIIVTK